MPCIKGETTLTDFEINSFLCSLQTEPLTDKEISGKLNLPLFQVRSKLRELIRLNYVEKKKDKYKINRLKG
jgi:predicted transcriptional regulator